MLVDIPDKKLLTIANRYFPALQDDEIIEDNLEQSNINPNMQTEQKKLNSDNRKNKSTGSQGLLNFDEKKLVSMQHFEQIELDKIDEFLTTADQEEDPLEVSLL